MATPNTRRNKDARSDDLYTTPFDAVHDIMRRESINGSIIDAGCGTGNIAEVVKQYCNNTTAVDLNDHGYGSTGVNFLQYENKHSNAISNPPFTLLEQFINQCLKITSDKVLIFCRVTALESAKRYESIYKDNPPSRIYYYVSRVSCSKGGLVKSDSSAVFYCWVVWDKKSKRKETISYWIDNRKGAKNV